MNSLDLSPEQRELLRDLNTEYRIEKRFGNKRTARMVPVDSIEFYQEVLNRIPVRSQIARQIGSNFCTVSIFIEEVAK